MAIDTPTERPINRIANQVKPRQPLLVTQNLGKKLVHQKRARARKPRTAIQRVLDLVLSLRKSSDLLTAIRETQTVKLPQSFLEEGGTQPSTACRERAQEILRQLFHGTWLPARIGASLAGGIMLVYRSSDGTVFEIETENDLLISCVVSKGNSVLASEEFTNVASVNRFVKYNQFCR